jgi:spermidine/putrescine transport system substrate-binding protein
MSDQPLLDRPITRRALLVGGSLAGFAAFLAACAPAASNAPATGTPAPAGTPGPAATTGPTTAPTTPPITGPLNFANWDAYIDLTTLPGPDGKEGTDDDEYDLPSPTLDDFKAEYKVEVNYANAEIDGNDTFLATIQPQLQSGVDPGWDLIVLTDWMAAKVIAAGWAEQIDPAHIPTVLANVNDSLKGLPYDPDFKFHVPWQSGATGLGYNSESTGRALTKMADAFDPAFAGKVTLLDDTRDVFPLIHMMLQAQGKASANPPESMNVADVEAVHAYLKPFVESGHIRAFRGNAYLQDFGSGDTWVAQVWSGDLASSGGENDVFVYPEEGANLWTDNMIIPKGAKNKYTAELMMDWVYDVDRAARLANFIYYISPVKGVGEAILKLDPELEGNELLFPPADVVARLHSQPNYDEATEAKVNELYADLAGV